MAKNKKKKKRTPPRLCVAFDTNILYTHVAHNLLQKEAREFIKKNSDHTDLEVEWYLSEVVTGERQYQMMQAATELYEKVELLERLLGHQITTKEIVSDRIRRVIDEQMTELGIRRLELNSEEVDWAGIIGRSIARSPPFDPKSKEKGFRDAVIAEAFLQLVNRSPTTAALCRLAFVSGDAHLRSYLTERLDDRQNVRILENLNELEGLVNTLVSKVPEEKIKEWQQKAKQYFFTEGGDKSTWFYRGEIRDYLSEHFSEQLAETPEGSYSRRDGKWYIGFPVFLKKDRQRLHWMTEIQATSKLFKLAESNALSGGLFGFSEKRGLLGGSWVPNLQNEVGTAKTTFELYWSVSVSTQLETLSRPAIDDAKFIKTDFDVAQSSVNTLADLLRDHKSESES